MIEKELANIKIRDEFTKTIMYAPNKAITIKFLLGRRDIHVLIPLFKYIEYSIVKTIESYVEDEILFSSKGVVNDEEIIKIIEEKVDEVLGQYYDMKSEEWREKRELIIFHTWLRFKEGGLLELLLQDDDIEDLWVNSEEDVIWIKHRLYGRMIVPISLSRDELEQYIFAKFHSHGKTLNILNPIDDIVDNDIRISASIPSPLTENKYSLSIRKRRRKIFPPSYFVYTGQIDYFTMSILWLLVELKKPILITGVVSSGKTTFSNALLYLTPPWYRLIFIETSPELKPPHKNVKKYIPPNPEKAIEILKKVLRQYADMIIYGEIVDMRTEVYPWLQASMITGSMTTYHASGVEEMLTRLKANLEVLDIDLGVLRHVAAFVSVGYVSSTGEEPEKRWIKEVFLNNGIRENDIELYPIRISPRPDILEQNQLDIKALNKAIEENDRETFKEYLLDWKKPVVIENIEKQLGGSLDDELWEKARTLYKLREIHDDDQFYNALRNHYYFIGG